MSTTSSSPVDFPQEDFELSFNRLAQFLSPEQVNNIPRNLARRQSAGSAVSGIAVIEEGKHDKWLLAVDHDEQPQLPLSSSSPPSLALNSVNMVSNWRESFPLPTDKLGYLLDNDLWHDVKFLVGDPATTAQEVMSAHRLILGMSSSVFEAMLFGPLSNSSGQEEVIEIPDVDPTAFNLMLKVMLILILTPGDNFTI